MYKFILGCFFLILLGMVVSCDHKAQESVSGFSISKFIFEVDLPPSVSPNLSLPFIWFEEEDEFLAAYSYTDHSIVIINLSQRAFVNKVRLITEGPDFVQSVRAISIWDKNTLLIGGNDYITLITLEGKVIRRLLINNTDSDFTGFDFTVGRLSVNKYSGLQYSPSDKSILMEVYYFTKQSDAEVNPLMVSLNLETLHIEQNSVPVKLFRTAGNYGELRGVNFWRNNDVLTINYKSSSQVLIKNSMGESIFSMKSNNTPNDAGPIEVMSGSSNVSIFEHQVRSANFYPVITDNYRNLFYRIVKGENINFEDDEDFYLSVASKDFVEYMEIPFPKGYYIFGIPSKEGLMFIAYNKHDDKLELVNYRFELEK
ncbi:DUF4221 family protein [Roseivirga sp.]|uniref:DUF4221 family protein n=1 Tax=Roseivirga sp. TaxID=1964215 RepID=UPI003B8C77C2